MISHLTIQVTKQDLQQYFLTPTPERLFFNHPEVFPNPPSIPAWGSIDNSQIGDTNYSKITQSFPIPKEIIVKSGGRDHKVWYPELQDVIHHRYNIYLSSLHNSPWKMIDILYQFLRGKDYNTLVSLNSGDGGSRYVSYYNGIHQYIPQEIAEEHPDFYFLKNYYTC